MVEWEFAGWVYDGYSPLGEKHIFDQNGEPFDNPPWLSLSWNDGIWLDRLSVERGRDWENEISTTILFTGLNQDGTAIWGNRVGN